MPLPQLRRGLRTASYKYTFNCGSARYAAALIFVLILIPILILLKVKLEMRRHRRAVKVEAEAQKRSYASLVQEMEENCDPSRDPNPAFLREQAQVLRV